MMTKLPESLLSIDCTQSSIECFLNCPKPHLHQGACRLFCKTLYTPSRLFLLVGALLGVAALSLAARDLGLVQILDALVEELKVFGRVSTGRTLAGRRGRVLIGSLIQLLIVGGTRRLGAKEFTDSRLESPDRQSDKGSIFDCWLGKLVGLVGEIESVQERTEAARSIV